MRIRWFLQLPRSPAWVSILFLGMTFLNYSELQMMSCFLDAFESRVVLLFLHYTYLTFIPLFNISAGSLPMSPFQMAVLHSMFVLNLDMHVFATSAHPVPFRATMCGELSPKPTDSLPVSLVVTVGRSITLTRRLKSYRRPPSR